MADFDRVAADVRTWGRLGATRRARTSTSLPTIRCGRRPAWCGWERLPLVIAFGDDGPRGIFKFRTNPIHLMTVRRGDARLRRVRPQWTGTRRPQVLPASSTHGSGSTDDYIMRPLQPAPMGRPFPTPTLRPALHGFLVACVTSHGAVQLAASTRSSERHVFPGRAAPLRPAPGGGTALYIRHPITPAAGSTRSPGPGCDHRFGSHSSSS